MSTKNNQGKFDPLLSEEWLKTVKQSIHSELKILYYVRFLDLYSKDISLTLVQIAKGLYTDKSQMNHFAVNRAS